MNKINQFQPQIAKEDESIEEKQKHIMEIAAHEIKTINRLKMMDEKTSKNLEVLPLQSILTQRKEE